MPTLSEAYNNTPHLFGSPKMLAFYECLARVPMDDRHENPKMGSISITSDGFLIVDGNFMGSVDDLENNLKGLCEHFGASTDEVKVLMSSCTDWRMSFSH